MTLYIGMSRDTGRAITESDHLRQSVRDILLTPQGSRLARREYGSLLSALIDQPQNPALRLQIMAAVYVALRRWEPRLQLDTITVNSSNMDGAMWQASVMTACPCPFPYRQEQTMAVIDLSQLPPPQIVDVPDFETLLTERKAEFVALFPAEEQEAVARTLTLESEPVVKMLQENVYRELLLRQRINEAARAVMVAYSGGDDLDNLGANNNVQRRVITAADDTTTPPTEAVMESDADYRQRIPAAFEGMSVAGPVGAYEYHALSSDGRVADASAFSPSPAEVVVTILARDGDGTAPEDLLQVVGEALNDEAVRPVADRVSVRSAEIVPYEIDAVLYVYPGPAKEPILAAAKAQGTAYINEQRRLGRDVRLSAIYAALHVQGVQRVELIKPLTDMVLDKTQASYCTDFKAEIGGSDD